MYNVIINVVFDVYVYYKFLVDMYDNIYLGRILVFIEVKFCWSYNLC